MTKSFYFLFFTFFNSSVYVLNSSFPSSSSVAVILLRYLGGKERRGADLMRARKHVGERILAGATLLLSEAGSFGLWEERPQQCVL